jgi:ATP-binding cassette, subfamily B, bacterial
MTKDKEQQVSNKDIFRYAWHYWRRQPRMGALLLAGMAAATAVDAFVPVYTGRIVDTLVSHAPGEAAALHSALVFLAIFTALNVAHNVLRSGSQMLWARFAVRCMYQILTESLHRVQRFSADWHANSFAGATVRKITRGMWAFDVFEDTLFMGLLPAAVIMVSMAAVLLAHLPLVGAFALFMIVLYSAVSIWISVVILSPRFRESAKADTKVGATLADIVTGNPTVKSFGAETHEDGQFAVVATNWHRLSLRAWLTGETCNFLRGALRIVMMAGMIGVTVWLWQHGRATPGDIAFSLTSFFVISGYLRDIGQHIANLQRSLSEMEDVTAFWLREDEVRDAPNAAVFAPKKGEIVFDRVRFAYKGQDRPLYDDFSIRIRPGERVALVGQSGSGKSTFVKLVQRLYDVQGGEIRIDGQNIAAVTQESLRRALALVPQEPILFHRSLSVNIAYGKPDAPMDEIVAAAKKAYADEFIRTLSQGYDTLVGERGVKLSGGERQRVAIARAILADAPVLILDEATSSLDSVSEHYIQKALEQLMHGRTTITIAHRLATIRAVDRILVFDQGRIVEQGSHDELVARPGSHYRRLYEMQALGLIGEEPARAEAAE